MSEINLGKCKRGDRLKCRDGVMATYIGRDDWASWWNHVSRDDGRCVTVNANGVYLYSLVKNDPRDIVAIMPRRKAAK